MSQPPAITDSPPLNKVRGWRTIRLEILKRDGYRCQIGLPACMKVATEVDHIVPRASGGGHQPENLRGACRNCFD